MRLRRLVVDTADLARSQSFYRALGFRVVTGKGTPSPGPAPWEGPVVALDGVEDGGEPGMALELDCGDLPRVLRRLSKAGIAVEPPQPGDAGSGDGRVRRVTDPDGRTIDIRETRLLARLEHLLASDAHRAGWLAVGALLGAVIVVSVLNGLGVDESPTVVTVLLLPLLVHLVVSGRLYELTGPGGWGAKFAELRRQQDLQASDIEALRVALRGLVSRYELNHLRGLERRPFMVHYCQELYDELKRLDDFGFVRPRPELPNGLQTLVERYGHEHLDGVALERRSRFDLHDYVELTPEGHRYLELHRNAGPQPER